MDGAQVVPDPVPGQPPVAPPSGPLDLRVDDERRAVDGRLLRPRRVLAVMSGDGLAGRVRRGQDGQDGQAYAVMGSATVGLRRADLPAHVRVRAVAVMGGVEVLVPCG